MNSHLKISAVIAALALLVPAGAAAKRPDDKPAKGNKHGKAHKQGKPKTLKTKLVTANVKGMVEANDGTNMTVHVVKASGQAKACKGSSLTFDVSDARFHTADNNDGRRDERRRRARRAHRQGPLEGRALEGAQDHLQRAEARSSTAKAVHNRTTPKVDDDELDEDELLEDEDEFSDEDEFLDGRGLLRGRGFLRGRGRALDDDEVLEDDEFVDDEELDDF